MNEFITKIKRKVDRGIRQIETSENDILKRSLTTSEMLEGAFEQIKTFITNYPFKDENEEIEFFKDTKPRIFCKLIFYRKIYNIELERPMGSVDAQIEYFNKELSKITEYVQKRLAFYRYYRSGANHYDHIYFTRGKQNIEELYKDSFYFERDPAFSTPYDFTLAKFLANDMLQIYIHEELDDIGQHRFLFGDAPYPTINGPRWTDKKTGLIEILYALDTLGCFENGKISLKKIQEFAETHFDIRLGNISRSFNDMRIRDNPVQFIDSMRIALLQRMELSENKRIEHYIGNR